MVCDAKTLIWVMGKNWGSVIFCKFFLFCFCAWRDASGLKIKGRFRFSFSFFLGIWLFSFHLNVILHQWKVWQRIGSADLVVVKILVWSVYLSVNGRVYADWYEIICRNAYEMVISPFIVNFLFFFKWWIYDRKLDFLVCSQ